jgi:hypothetical protein
MWSAGGGQRLNRANNLVRCGSEVDRRTGQTTNPRDLAAGHVGAPDARLGPDLICRFKMFDTLREAALGYAEKVRPQLLSLRQSSFRTNSLCLGHGRICPVFAGLSHDLSVPTKPPYAHSVSKWPLFSRTLYFAVRVRKRFLVMKQSLLQAFRCCCLVCTR